MDNPGDKLLLEQIKRLPENMKDFRLTFYQQFMDPQS